MKNHTQLQYPGTSSSGWTPAWSRTGGGWTVEMWDCHWVPNLISISFCIDIVSSDDKPCLFSEGDAAQNHHTYTTERCYLISATINPHFDPTIQLLQQNLDSSVNISFLHMLKFQCTCCRHQQNWAWWWKAVMVGFLEGLLDQSSAHCLWLLNAGVVFLGCPLHNLWHPLLYETIILLTLGFVEHIL